MSDNKSITIRAYRSNSRRSVCHILLTDNYDSQDMGIENVPIIILIVFLFCSHILILMVIESRRMSLARHVANKLR
jgi:hypothetical protein